MKFDPKFRVESPRLLIVEGSDELLLLNAARSRVADFPTVQIHTLDGKDALKKFLDSLRSMDGFSGLQWIAILRDADDSASAAFDSVAKAVRGAGFEAPLAHAEYSSGIPRVGVFIVPDGDSPGMLETLCVSSVRNSPGMECVNEFLKCAKRADLSPKTPEKAQAYAWLAIQSNPGKRVGEGAEFNSWDLAHPDFSGLWNFLRQMNAST